MQANKFQLCLAACAASLSASQTPAQETIYGATGGDFLFGFSGSYRYAHASSPVIGPGADEVESFVARGNLSWFGSREHELGFELAPGFVADESS
ncbi:MAG: hypothetical protein RL112_2393, partial [Planctomycetota bacterium]